MKKLQRVEVLKSFIYDSPEFGDKYVIPVGTVIHSDSDFIVDELYLHSIDIFMENIDKYKEFVHISTLREQ